MNFIIIVSDTFRFDNLACYTQRRPRFQTPRGPAMTPNLDRFAQSATIFDNAYAGSFPTVPHRKDTLMGRSIFPWEGWSPLAEGVPTLPSVLRQAGYETMMVLDTPHIIRRGFNFDRDFDGYDFVRGQETDQLASWLADQPFDPALLRGANNWRQQLANIAETRHGEQDTFVAQTMTRAARWLEGWYNRGRRKPFLLYVDTFDPHEPWDAPAWYENLYDSGFEGPVNRYPAQGRIEGKFSKREVGHFRALYAAEVTLVDRWIGFLLETAERMGLYDDTLILFTADHGYLIGEHDTEGKAHGPLYEEIAHVPLLVHLPRQTRARRVASMVQPCDFAPTLIDLAGAKKPEAMTGVSLAPMLQGAARPIRRYAFSSGCYGGNILRNRFTITGEGWAFCYPDTKQMRAAVDASETGAAAKKSAAKSKGNYWEGPELYDLRTDPLQQSNVLKSNLPQARKMYRAYEAWLRAVGAPDTIQLPPCP